MFSKFFIYRPIFTVVVTALIILAGIASMTSLPIAQYPTITPVQILVLANYPGADAKTVSSAVAAPIEAQINGVEKMLYMTSTSSNAGQMALTVYFSLDTDPDIAQVLVQNRVNLAMAQLPTVVQQGGVIVSKRSSNILMIINIFSKTGHYSADYITNYANIYILDALKRVKGAGQAQIFGVPDQAMRVWLNPDSMASLGISVQDVQDAIARQNALFGLGQIGQQPNAGPTQLTFPIITQPPFSDPQQYENIILRANQTESAIVRIGDIAKVDVGRKQYIDRSMMNGYPSTPIMVYQQPGANGLDVANGVRNQLKEIAKTLPDGIEYAIALDTTEFVRLSIIEVIITLVEAIVLVVVVVYLFLQNFAATLICTAAIFVSIIGSFTGLWLLGFSINLLTLFAMVLAIGIVVDDAIVVVENVERNLNNRLLSSKEAAARAMEEVSGPVIAVVLVLAAVFVPAAFLPGTTGQLYKQFATTIVISVAISGFVALTLTPAMCGIMLTKPHPHTRGFFAWFNRNFDRLTGLYGRSVAFVLKKAWIALLSLVLMCGLAIFLFNKTPVSFLPVEDQGYLLAQLFMPDATSLEQTDKVARQLDEMMAGQLGVLNRTIVTGYSMLDSQYQTNVATFFITLEDFSKRYRSISSAFKENAYSILMGIYGKAKTIDKGFLIPIPPPPIPGIGISAGFDGWIQDLGSGDSLKLYELVQAMIEGAKKRPEIGTIHSTFKASTMQLMANVNRDMAALLNVPIEDVYGTLQTQFGSKQVSQYTQYSRVWNVILQSEAQFREQPSDIGRLYTKAKIPPPPIREALLKQTETPLPSASMVPLSALVTTSYTSGPAIVPHFNGFPAALISGGPAPGYSSGDALKAMEEVAAEVLPSGYVLAWSGMALQEKSSEGSSLTAFSFGLLIVFLILAAQYESWALPLSVITAVPFGVIGAFIAIALRGLSNDVYFQIGLLVLIGLSAKNAVLIVEFAVKLRKEGEPLIKAAVNACERRFRPIIMTSLAFIFGVLPLALAMGTGAMARHSIGTGIIGGMIGATTLALIYTPLFFYLFMRLSERFYPPSMPPAIVAKEETALAVRDEDKEMKDEGSSDKGE